MDQKPPKGRRLSEIALERLRKKIQKCSIKWSRVNYRYCSGWLKQILKHTQHAYKSLMQSNSTNSFNSSPIFSFPLSNVQQKPTTNLFGSYPNPPVQMNVSSNINASQNPFKNNLSQYPPVQVQQVQQVQQVPFATPFGSYQNIFGNVAPNNNPYIPQQALYFSLFGNAGGQEQRPDMESYADDQLIPQNMVAEENTQPTVGESKIDFTLASQFQQVRLGQPANLTCVCSVTGTGGSRASVDVLCLIDQSGSMFGEKIQLVRDTMKYVLKMLTPKDRLSIAVYEDVGSRVCPFKFVNEDNQQSLLNIINELRAGGGNIMIDGLEVAIKMLRERRTRNEVTSIFLLSDGQEPHNTEQMFRQMLEKPQNKDLGSFSLHSFGFGNDHDQNLMTKICSIKDGNFYFINKLSTLDEAFCNALGGIITQTASDIEIELECIAPAPVEGISIGKVYGNKWNKVGEKKYSISINQMMSEVPKDFVFELSIPKIAFQALDANRNLQILRASYTAKDTITGGQLKGQTTLKLEFFDESAALKRQSNPGVIEPYFRLLAVETMNSSIKLAEQGKFEEAKRQINDILETIKYHPQIRKEKVKGLIEDLEFAKQKCTQQVFHSEGRKEMVNLCYANTNNCSYQFSNQCQQQMLSSLRQAKRS